MKKITSVSELRESIIQLEIQQAIEMSLMKEEFKVTCENLRPVNLIKNKFNDIVGSPNLKENILDATLSLAVGYLSKKAVVGSTHNPMKQLLGTLLQVGVTSLVAKNSDSIRSTVMQFIQNYLNKRSVAS